jgi:hypothetical protein
MFPRRDRPWSFKWRGQSILGQGGIIRQSVVDKGSVVTILGSRGPKLFWLTVSWNSRRALWVCQFGSPLPVLLRGLNPAREIRFIIEGGGVPPLFRDDLLLGVMIALLSAVVTHVIS